MNNIHSIISDIHTEYKNAIVYDAHGCPSFSVDADFSVLNRYKNSGVTFLSLNVGYGNMKSVEVLPIIERIRNFVLKNPSDYCLVQKGSDIEDCKAHNKLGIAFDLEGADTLDGSLDTINQYYQLGVRQLLVSYNKNNAAGGGCDDKDNGLTLYGKSIIRCMNEVGMFVDCSHVGEKTTLEIMEISTSPVIFSHSNPSALYPHPRNISDDQIKACAQTGGIIGINGIGIFLGENNTSTKKIVEHIDYVAQLVGPQHVGIGLDYVFDQPELEKIVKESTDIFPVEQGYQSVNLAKPEQFPEIYSHLIKYGYSEYNVQEILGGNFYRLAKLIWK